MVPAGGSATAALTDTYSRLRGSLTVSKTIAGPAAGQQGPVSIQVVCDGTTLTPGLTLPAGAAAGTTSRTYDDLPAGSRCTVSELTNGATSALSVSTVGGVQHVTVPAGKTVGAVVLNTYDHAPGTLTVTKTVAGPAAGQQAAISILADCGANNVFGLRIPEGAPAGPVPQTFYGIPAGSTCKVVEIEDGHSETIDVARVGDGQKVTVPAGGRAHAFLIDSFTAAAVVTTTHHYDHYDHPKHHHDDYRPDDHDYRPDDHDYRPHHHDDGPLHYDHDSTDTHHHRLWVVGTGWLSRDAVRAGGAGLAGGRARAARFPAAQEQTCQMTRPARCGASRVGISIADIPIEVAI